jgi:hypothetical protein
VDLLVAALSFARLRDRLLVVTHGPFLPRG